MPLRPVSLAFLVCLATTCAAQPAEGQAAQPPQRDPQAIGAVQQAIAALGGPANLQVHNAVVQGTIQNLSDSPNSTLTFIWKDDWGGTRHEFRRETHEGATADIFVSGSGKPANAHDAEIRAVPSYTALSCAAFHLPGVVLMSEINDTRHSFRYMGSASLNGAPAIHVRAAWDTDPFTALLTTQDWYFDPASGLPLRVEYLVADTRNPNLRQTVSIDYGDFRVVSGVVIPFRLTGHGVAGETGVAALTSVNLNPGVSATDFSLGSGVTP